MEPSLSSSHDFAVAPNPRNIEQLQARFFSLQQENDALRAQVHGSFFEQKEKVFLKATGFANAIVAQREMRISGAFLALERTQRHQAAPTSATLEDAAAQVQAMMPGFSDEVEEALRSCKKRVEKFHHEKRSTKGRKRTIDDEHFFLVPFLYIVGGFQMWEAPLLPGIHLSESHFSRLLHIAAPIVAEKWCPRFFTMRSLAWLRKFCPPEAADAGQDVDAVLFYDGSKYEMEHSQGIREQRGTFSSVVNFNILQFIGLTNARGWFVAASTFAGGKMKESDMAWTMDFWDNLAELAEEDGKVFHLKLIVDRGFRDNKKKIEEEQASGDWPWKRLKITCQVVHHLGTDLEPERKQHDEEEVDWNRYVQARRWVNEKAFAYFNISRFFRRLIEIQSVGAIETFKTIALATANMRMRVPPPELENMVD